MKRLLLEKTGGKKNGKTNFRVNCREKERTYLRVNRREEE
jgi:hypothetical protein